MDFSTLQAAQSKEATDLVAKRDLSAIRALRGNTEFNAYFLRRLKARRDELHDLFYNAPPDKVDKDERELLRRMLKEYDGILGMLDREEGEILAQLDPTGTVSG